MMRFLTALALVCGLSYALYPQECRVVATRLTGEVRSAALTVRGAVRGVLPHEKQPPPPAPVDPQKAARGAS